MLLLFDGLQTGEKEKHQCLSCLCESRFCNARHGDSLQYNIIFKPHTTWPEHLKAACYGPAHSCQVPGHIRWLTVSRKVVHML